MLAKSTLARVCLRSLLLQATWNFERMQNLGFAYALWPALSELYREPERLDQAARRHLEVFNTHPYMASIVLGVVLNMEEDLAEGGSTSEAQVRSIKLGLLGSYGAIGDGLIWGAVKPLAFLCGLLAGVATSPWVAVLVFLGVYNAGHVALRVGGFFAGYRMGVPAVLKVRDLNLPRWTKRLRTAALAALGALAGWWVVAEVHVGRGGLSDVGEAAALVALAYGVWRYLSMGRSITALVYWVAAGAVIASAAATLWGF